MADDAVLGAGQRDFRVPAQSGHPTFGMEALDLMGIDIDQDPRAFAQFLELTKLMQARSTRRRFAPKPIRRR